MRKKYKHRRVTSRMIVENDDPRGPIVIYNIPPSTNIDHERMVLYRTCEDDTKEKLKQDMTSLHSTWDIIYDIFKQKKKLEEQLEKANELMAKYKEQFGELDDEEESEDINEINENNIEKNTDSSTGAWFCFSSILIAAAILGGCYYLKR